MDIVLPCAADESPERLKKLRAFGRAMVKALYEGRRMGNRLCPSVFKFLTDTSPNMRDLQMFDPQTFRSLQWMLATIGVEEFGLHFEAVGAPELGVVTDSNKANFV
jgi:predicted GNAT family N-acyltransferase